MSTTPPATASKKFVPALGYHWLTPLYDVVVGRTVRERAFKHALIQQARIQPGQRVLDLACGTGTLSAWTKESEPAALITGVDGDTVMLERARVKAAARDLAIDFDLAMSTELPYPAAHFDRVLSSLFFHHLSLVDKERTLNEVARVLKPGGELHVADWGRSTGMVMRLLFVPIQLLDGVRNTQDNVRGKLPELFVQAGFSEVRETTTFSTIFGTMALYRASKNA